MNTLSKSLCAILAGIVLLMVGGGTPVEATNQPSFFVRVTPMCLGPGVEGGVDIDVPEGSYLLRVRLENAETSAVLSYNLKVGGTVVGSGTVGTDSPVAYHLIPAGTNGVKAVPDGAWKNSYSGTASTPQKSCEVPPTTTTPPTTVPPTTAPPTTEPPATTPPTTVEQPTTTAVVPVITGPAQTPSTTAIPDECWITSEKYVVTPPFVFNNIGEPRGTHSRSGMPCGKEAPATTAPVAPTSAAPTAAAASTGTLPSTGSNLTTLFVVAASLLAMAGTAIVRVARR